MFKDAEAMWSSVRGGNTSSPVSAVAMLQKRGVITGSGTRTLPACTPPAHNVRGVKNLPALGRRANSHGDAGCCVSLVYR